MAGSSTSSEQTVQVARIVTATRAEGPGLRSALWVAGCSLRCHGCFNPHLFEFTAGDPWRPDSVARALLQDHRIEGVTFLGGEPFDQAEALAEVARIVRLQGKTVMVFTGYRLEHLQSRGGHGSQALLDQTDILADGPFLESRLDTERPWLGSTNQRLIRFDAGGGHDFAGSDCLEVNVRIDGLLEVNGWATTEQLRRLQALVEQDDL